MKEIWKTISKHSNYKVSNRGRIYNTKTKRCIKGSNSDGYQYVSLRSDSGNVKQHRIHRLVVSEFVGTLDDKNEVDHIDGNKQNNNVSNLRICTRAQNNQKRRLPKRTPNGTSKYRGVCKFKNKFRARINFEGQVLQKYFDDEEEAATQYNEWAKKYHKEYAILNNI